MDTHPFNTQMQAIGELHEAGAHGPCLDAVRALRLEILAAPDPVQLGWTRFYELRALFELGRHEEALAALARPEPVAFSIGARNAAWMSSVASEMAMHLGRVDEIVRHGRACLALRAGADRIACCSTVCNLLWAVGRDDLNRDFAAELVELGQRHGDRAALVRGLHGLLDACAITPDPELLAQVQRSATVDDGIAARLAALSGGPAPSQHSLARCAGQPWFDPGSSHDRRVLGLDPAVTASPLARGHASVEVDALARLRDNARPEVVGPHTTVIFQQWGPPARDGSRAYQWLDRTTAAALGATLRHTPARRLALVVTTVQDGALRVLADALIDTRPVADFRMETLTLAWYFSGDDITDDEHHVDDLAYAATRLQVRRLAVLTGAWNEACDQRLAAALASADLLERCTVFAKDGAHTWPPLATPSVDALLGRRRAGARGPSQP